MIQNSVLSLLQKQHAAQPSIAFIDFDGTLYTAGPTMWKTLYFNRKTSHILKHNHIPLAIVTGRATWNKLSDMEIRFFRMKQADIIISGAGTEIYYRNLQNKLSVDKSWTQILQKTKIVYVENNLRHETSWDKEKLFQVVFNLPQISFLSRASDRDNEFVLRFSVRNLSVTTLNSILSELKKTFPSGVKVQISEKLFQKNTLSVYSGDIFLIPQAAGKDNAIIYLLKKYSKEIKLSINAYTFGDASIDVDMLTLTSHPPLYTFSHYGVHLTPLAKAALEKAPKDNIGLTISNDEGPKVIYNAFKKLKYSHFTPAQNNPARLLLRPFEKTINKIVYPNLNANQLSFKGLRLVIEGVDQIYNPKTKYQTRLNGFQKVLKGNSLDLFDGMRARQASSQTSNLKPQTSPSGQLVDVFCDRTKEFYQLYIRAKLRFIPTTNDQRLTSASEAGYTTLLTAISCILPSIARAQCESQGVIVRESDHAGGSMLNRTKNLIRSLSYDLVNQHTKSLATDQQIYKSNIKTYKSRLRYCEESTNISKNNLNPYLIKSATSRYQLLIQLLREENDLALNILEKYPQFKTQYQKEFLPILKPYLLQTKNQRLKPNNQLSLHKILPMIKI